MNTISKSLIIIIFVISLLLLSGCTKLRYQFDPSYQKCDNLSQKNYINPRGWNHHSDRNICIFSLARNYSDVSLCNEMSLEGSYLSDKDHPPAEYIGICGGAIAFSQNDTQLCDQLNNEESRTKCLKFYNDAGKCNQTINQSCLYECY